MTNQLKPGQNLLLNNRLWSLWQVRPLEGPNLELEIIGASQAAQGMTRRLKAAQYGSALFIERRQGDYWQADLEQDWVQNERGPALNCQPATALDLLAAHTRYPAHGRLKNRFSWSFSRAAKYNQCPRAYYYHYYAAWNGWQTDAPAPVRQTYLLKNLTDIPRWVGALVHESIKFAVARLKAGQPVADRDLLEQMHRRAQADFEDSKSGRYARQPNQLTGFQEHYYRTNPPQDMWQAAWAKAERCLRAFLNSPLYADLQRSPAEAFLNVEELRAFTIAQTRVWIQMDLALRRENAIYLYDWKTGEVTDEPAIWQQLGIYGLYIRHTWPEWSALPLKGVVFNLARNHLFEVDLIDEVLRNARAATEASIAGLQNLLLNPQTNQAELRRFPMIDELSVCRSCQFRALCGRDKG